MYKKVNANILEVMQLKNGDILFLDKNTNWGNLVGWFQGDRYHHVGIIIKFAGEIYVFEALAQGMVFTPFSKYEEKIASKGWSIIIKRFKDNRFENVKNSRVVHLCCNLTCVSYEFVNLLGFQMIRYLWFKLFKKNLWIGKGKKNSEKTMICSELVGYIYNEFLGMYSSNWWKLAPSDIIKTEGLITVYDSEL